MLIYKVLRSEEWHALDAEGETDGAPVDRADGYIHFSTAEQVGETLARHFVGTDGLVIAACDAEGMKDALRWEPSRDGALFPHLYRRLRRDDVIWHLPIETRNGQHVVPGRVE